VPGGRRADGAGHAARGLGTFQPLHEEQVERARLHTERYAITEENAAKMRAATRLVMVGTTSVRTVESALREGAMRRAAAKRISSFIRDFSFAARGRC